MKSAHVCVIVTLIAFGGCAVADLEFYPEYQHRELPEQEWAKGQPLSPDLQRYLAEQRAGLYRQEQYLNLNRGKQTDLTWPNAATHDLFKNQQNLARRITEITRKYEESSRRPQYYFKTHGLTKEQEARLKLFDALEDRKNNPNEFVPKYRPNFHILDDVRLQPDTVNLDLNLPNEDATVEEDAERIDREFIQESNEEKQDEDVKTGKDAIKVAENPTEFAYPPSDPRYFEEEEEEKEEKEEEVAAATDSDPIEVIKPSSNHHRYHQGDKSKEDDGYFSNAATIQVHNRNEGFYQEPFMGLREAGRRSDDTLEVVAIKPRMVDDTTGVYIIAIVAGISAAATVGLIAFGIGWYNLQKHVKNASDVEYPAYGVTGPNKDISPSGDRRLAQSAQMYHYQHQKQQIIAMERAAANERHGSVSEVDSDEENEEGDYTVYECPGLAPTGEMEVKNPLFQDDPTPAQTPAMKTGEENGQKK